MFNWKFIQLYANENQLIGVHYLLSATNGTNTVETEGNHTFSEGIVNKPLSEIVESDLTQWIEKDTTQDDVNPIKLTLENQLNALENIKKVDFPWLAGTFTI
jgi:hypothetical protein